MNMRFKFIEMKPVQPPADKWAGVKQQYCSGYCF